MRFKKKKKNQTTVYYLVHTWEIQHILEVVLLPLCCFKCCKRTFGALLNNRASCRILNLLRQRYIDRREIARNRWSNDLCFDFYIPGDSIFHLKNYIFLSNITLQDVVLAPCACAVMRSQTKTFHTAWCRLLGW